MAALGRILVVEDDPKMARFVELELAHEGYEVDRAADGREGAEKALASDYDLVLLDVMLPQLSGLEVLRRIRREKQTPVIMLTARDAVMDKVAGLDLGADDYMTKPFAIEELLARIRVALKHREEAQAPAASGQAPQAPAAAPAGPAPGALGVRGVVLDPVRHLVSVNGEQVELTNREFEVLRALLENVDRVLTREQLVQMACGYDYVGETNIIDVYVRHIRAKIDDPFDVKLITTVRGVGYVVRAR